MNYSFFTQSCDSFGLVNAIFQIKLNVWRGYRRFIFSHLPETKLALIIEATGVHFAILSEKDCVIPSTGNLLHLDMIKHFNWCIRHKHMLKDSDISEILLTFSLFFLELSSFLILECTETKLAVQT